MSHEIQDTPLPVLPPRGQRAPHGQVRHHYAHPSCYQAAHRTIEALSSFVRDRFHETLDAEWRARVFAAMARAGDQE
jgi:hypothetical protein